MLPSRVLIATNRFGLGANSFDVLKAQSNPKKWLHDQISSTKIEPEIPSKLPSSDQILLESYLSRGIKDEDKKQDIRKIRRKQFYGALSARLKNQIKTEHPFAERLVMFWSNHFTVSRTRGIIGPAIPAYENEAIRPHIFGPFEDMLLSVVQHPCMLIYLDNISSIGPNSLQGKRRGKDLNENLAREILELHTIGAQGGYTQADVTNFAKIITGWTVARKRKNARRQKTPPGNFMFNNRVHEPGEQILLGQTFRQNGQAQGIEALKHISRHPSTAKFIATKLVRHFVNDNPPAQAVEKIERVFKSTNGNLAKVSHALIDLDEAWDDTGTKVKSPEELVISTLRALYDDGLTALPPRRFLFPALKTMGQDIFHAPSPAGWPDEAEKWISPESLKHRIEWVRAISQYSSLSSQPLDVFANTIAPFTTDDIQKLIKGAPSREDGLALIFASPAFQRR
ncbi:MAG: DUF1800 domain-containing protein [Hyphomonadaceae bacterium]|nr:DUF1800 domain-containing protein [Hyphomonadaceae bacterium]